MSTLVVTGSDFQQFDLALRCIETAASHLGDYSAEFAFLDLGCTPEQLDALRSRGVRTHQVGWEYGIINTIPTIDCRKGPLAKPFLRNYFPGFTRFIWLDADTWTQSSEAVELLCRATETRGAGFVLETHRGSKFIHGALGNHLSFVRSLMELSYGATHAESLALHAHINTGVFSLSVDSPLWDAWKKSVVAAIPGLVNKNLDGQQLHLAFAMLDQVALNHAVRSNQLTHRIEFLPETCNWQCHLGLPAYDDVRGLFVEPYLPHRTISIMHLTAPWGGAVGRLPEPYLKSTQYSAPAQGAKESFRTCDIRTLAGQMVVKSLFAPDDAEAGPPPTGPLIPKHLFQKWAGSPPQYVQEMIQSRLGPGWQYTYFDDDGVGEYLAQNKCFELPDVAERMSRMANGAHRAQLFRLFCLYRQGGFFLDSDAMFFCDLEKLCGNYDFLSVRSSAHPGAIFDGVLAATPRHPVIRDALIRACETPAGAIESDYYLCCKDLLHAVSAHTRHCRICLLHERRLGMEGDEITDHEGNICFRHYCFTKVIPEEARGQ
jgi:hypothetical protein